MADFVKYIRKTVGGPVLDRTGLKGTYDYDMTFGPHGPDDPVFAQISPEHYANLPDFFTVLEEKYGLKLVREKVSVDAFVIDYIDRMPTEN